MIIINAAAYYSCHNKLVGKNVVSSSSSSLLARYDMIRRTVPYYLIFYSVDLSFHRSALFQQPCVQYNVCSAFFVVVVQNDILMNKACTTTELLVSTVLKAKKTTVFLNFIFPRRRTVQDAPHNPTKKKRYIFM